jgi:hypothetical protein
MAAAATAEFDRLKARSIYVRVQADEAADMRRPNSGFIITSVRVEPKSKFAMPAVVAERASTGRPPGDYDVAVLVAAARDVAALDAGTYAGAVRAAASVGGTRVDIEALLHRATMAHRKTPKHRVIMRFNETLNDLLRSTSLEDLTIHGFVGQLPDDGHEWRLSTWDAKDG